MIKKYALTKIYTGQVGGEFFAEILPRIGEILRINQFPSSLALKVRRDVK